jgi:hypothetical protein
MALSEIDEFLIRRVSEADARRPGPKPREQPPTPAKIASPRPRPR